MASASTDAAEIRRRGRQRLIGAIAIVLLLVVFIPMLLDSEPRRPADEPPLDIPSKDNAPALPPPVAASSAAKAGPGVAPSSTPSPSSPVASAAPAGPSPPVEPASSADVQKTGPSARPSPKAEAENRSAANTAPLEGFAVQVGAFRDDAMLRHAREKLAAAGVPHYTERLDSAAGGPLTRLRAGPFPTRQAADGAAAKLKAAQLPAQVVPLP